MTISVSVGTTGDLNLSMLARLSAVELVAGRALPKAGGTMQGAINAAGFVFANLGTPVAATDAATKGYLDTALTAITDSLIAIGNTDGALALTVAGHTATIQTLSGEVAAQAGGQYVATTQHARTLLELTDPAGYVGLRITMDAIEHPQIDALVASGKSLGLSTKRGILFGVLDGNDYLGFLVTRSSIYHPAFQSLQARVAVLEGKLAYLPSGAPIATDGRWLTTWRGKLAALLQSGAGHVRQLWLGDSWAEKVSIPQQLATQLYGVAGQSGAGWISVNADLTSAGNNVGPLDGATFAKSGWTLFDITTSTTLPAFGCSIDGMAISAIGTAATASYTFTTKGLNGQFQIFRPKTAGTIRYQLDGGAWTSLTGDGSNALEVTTVAVPTAGTHTVNIDTTGNTGTAALFGLFYSSPGMLGAEVLKCGNSNMDASQWAAYVSSFVAPSLATLAPDVIVVILGTNDYRRSGGTAAYIATLTALVAAARAVLPTVGFVFVAPADTNATGTPPLTAYRDALAAFCIANGCEFYNMHDEWSSWAVENAAGQFFDSLHVNDVGAWRVAARLMRLFFSL